MKKTLWIMTVTTMMANTAYAELPDNDSSKIYFGIEVGKSLFRMKSDGYNTEGLFYNTNDDERNGQFLNAKLGQKISDRWRFDIAYREYSSQDYTTDSYEPPAPTFFYNSKVKQKAIMATAYYDFFKHNKLEFYGGLGIGLSRSKISTDDGVVEGSSSDTNFAWQVELGADYLVTESFSINAGLRNINFGTATAYLNTTSTGADAGTFTADISSKEAFLGVNYTF